MGRCRFWSCDTLDDESSLDPRPRFDEKASVDTTIKASKDRVFLMQTAESAAMD
jgi:hypothetical protein